MIIALPVLAEAGVSEVADGTGGDRRASSSRHLGCAGGALLALALTPGCRVELGPPAQARSTSHPTVWIYTAIYPGSLARTPSFRIGCIGQVYPDDIDRFVSVVAAWCAKGRT